MPAPYRGGCACSAIRYDVTAEPYTAYCCHCNACQKRTGSAFGLSMQVPTTGLVIAGETPRTRVRIADSGNEFIVHFCGKCGSSLYSAAAARPEVRVVYIGTLDDPTAVSPRLNIWTDFALPWLPLDPALPDIPRQPDFAKYYERPPES